MTYSTKLRLLKGGEEEVDVLEEVGHYQSDEGNLPVKSNPHRSSTDDCPSTSGTHFVCGDWVSCISIKRLKYVTCQFYLPSAILKLGPNDRPHIPSPRMAAFSEAIILGKASLPLHPFIIEVLTTSTSFPFNSLQIPSTPWWHSTSPYWRWTLANLQRWSSAMFTALWP